MACAAVVLCGFLWVWVGLVLTRATNAMYMRERTGLMVMLILSSVTAAMIFDTIWGGSRLALVSFYLCAWFSAEAVVVALKAIVGRQRPGVALAAELGGAVADVLVRWRRDCYSIVSVWRCDWWSCLRHLSYTQCGYIGEGSLWLCCASGAWKNVPVGAPFGRCHSWLPHRGAFHGHA